AHGNRISISIVPPPAGKSLPDKAVTPGGQAAPPGVARPGAAPLSTALLGGCRRAGTEHGREGAWATSVRELGAIALPHRPRRFPTNPPLSRPRADSEPRRVEHAVWRRASAAPPPRRFLPARVQRREECRRE